MEDNILQSVKKMLGLPAEYTAYDLDIMIHINSTFFVINQLGIGPAGGFNIETGEETWSSFLGGNLNFSSVKTLMYLRVRLLFDPPETSFTQDAMKNQISELEYRLSLHREELLPTLNSSTEVAQVIDGGRL